MDQTGLTVLATVLPGRKDALRDVLTCMDRDIASARRVPFQRVETLHFARLVLLEDTHELVFSSNFDGGRDRHYEDLAATVASELDAVFRHCRGYVGCGGTTSQRVARFLRAHDLGCGTFYTATRGLSVRRILADDELHQRLRRKLSSISTTLSDPQAVAFELGARASASRRTNALELARYYAGGFTKLAAGAACLPAILSLAPLVRLSELRAAKQLERQELRATFEELAARKAARDERARHFAEEESRRAARPTVQNALSHVVRLRGDWTSSLALEVALRYVGYRAAYWDTEGELAKIASIHFARWVRLPEQRLLFFSNYDGTWEGYLGQFVDRGAAGLSAIWSNTRGFPKTTLLFGQGARDERAFKRWARKNQLDTNVWYSAYPGLSVQNILDNAKLRRKFHENLRGEEAEKWLALI